MNSPMPAHKSQPNQVPLNYICLNYGRQHDCPCQKPSGNPCCGATQWVDCCFRCPCVCGKSN